MNLISTEEAAAIKKTSRFVVIQAIKRGVVDAIQVGGRYAVNANRKFERWQLSKRHVKAANTRWKKRRQ